MSRSDVDRPMAPPDAKPNRIAPASLPVMVITVGPNSSLYLSPLLKKLEAQGVRHLEASMPEDVPKLLGRNRKVAILLYNGPGEDLAQRVLRVVEQEHQDVPVIVVVNEAKFSEFYELMCQGAYDYFGLVEGMAVIEEAVRWAAHTDTVSARAAAMQSSPHTPQDEISPRFHAAPSPVPESSWRWAVDASPKKE